MFRVLRNKNGTRRLVVNCPHLSLDATIDDEGCVHVSSYEIRNDSTPSRGLGDTAAKMTKGPGDRFHELIVKKYGLKPCQKCNETIDLMNRLGIDGCKHAKADIIDDLWDRRDQLKGWRSVIAKLPGAEVLAKRELGRLFDQAL